MKKISKSEQAKFRGQLEHLFSKKFDQDGWEKLKLRGEKFIRHAFIDKPNEINFDEDAPEDFFRLQKFRLMLGLGCELILKSLYLKEGYAINLPKPNTIHFPVKLEDIGSEDLEGGRTAGGRKLVDNIDKLFGGFYEDIWKGFEIARQWRNKDIHKGGVYHREGGDDKGKIMTALRNTYDRFFDVKDLKSILKDVDTSPIKYIYSRKGS